MAGMGMVSKALDKLPLWAQVVLTVLGIVAGVFAVVRYGFWSVFLHAIFSPVP
jgi:F0F1-type ATP synthase assembly protein I